MRTTARGTRRGREPARFHREVVYIRADRRPEKRRGWQPRGRTIYSLSLTPPPVPSLPASCRTPPSSPSSAACRQRSPAPTASPCSASSASLPTTTVPAGVGACGAAGRAEFRGGTDAAGARERGPATPGGGAGQGPDDDQVAGRAGGPVPAGDALPQGGDRVARGQGPAPAARVAGPATVGAHAPGGGREPGGPASRIRRRSLSPSPHTAQAAGGLPLARERPTRRGRKRRVPRSWILAATCIPARPVRPSSVPSGPVSSALGLATPCQANLCACRPGRIARKRDNNLAQGNTGTSDTGQSQRQQQLTTSIVWWR